MQIKHIVSSFVLLVFACSLNAQETEVEAVRPVMSIIKAGVGGVSVRDTYLTPQLYSGENLSVQYERWHAWKHPRWVSQQTIAVRYGMPEDQGKHSEEWVGRLSYRYAAHYRWEHLLWQPLTLMVGPFTGVEAGFDYNLKLASGNNPATAKVVANVGVSAAALCHYQLRRQPCVVMFQMQVPMLGYALQPEYGASYYESFYLQTSGNNHHFTSWHNRQDLDVNLSTDMALSAIPFMRNNGNSLRLGVEYHIETMDINEVVTRYSTFEFVVGLVFQHMKYNRNRSNILRSEIHEAY